MKETARNLRKLKYGNPFINLELNEYLGLEQRVKGKMTTLNIVSTGDEDFLSPEMNDFKFRKRQLERLKDEVIEIEDANDSISLTDLNMNEYLYELSEYVTNTPQMIRCMRVQNHFWLSRYGTVRES